jgi:hypothetical protein
MLGYSASRGCGSKVMCFFIAGEGAMTTLVDDYHRSALCGARTNQHS